MSNPAIATVDKNGVLVPLSAGFTQVSATSGSVSATETISVRGPLPVATRSQSVGINLAGIAYWTTEFPFADMMKSGMGWNSRDDAGNWGAAFPTTSAQGYPTSLAPGQHALSAVAWSNVNYPVGQYVILWDGDGTVSAPLTNGVFKLAGTNRATLDMTDNTGAMWVGIDATNPANPVRNVRFLWPGTEGSYATQPFNVEFLKKINPFSLIRFMDWAASNGTPVVAWADRSQVADATYAEAAGVPIEVMIALANTLHVDPWFCIPYMASDDYVKQFATLLHATLDPNLHPHIEYSNEVWNTGFPQTTWAVAQSNSLGMAVPYGQPSIFYATRAVQVFNLMRVVYGADSGRLVRVLAGQAAWTQFSASALAYGSTASQVDVLAVAPYFGAAAAGDPANVATSLGLTSDQVVDQMLADIRGEVTSWMQANAALARQYKLKLKAYESGSGNTTYQFPSANQAAMTALFTAANRNPRMHDVETEYVGTWVAAGGDTMNQFNDIGGWSQWGFWSVLESVMQDPATAPRYQGLVDYIAAHPMAALP